jgi:CTP:molybdopterin cytidylyltransferase MocA
LPSDQSKLAAVILAAGAGTRLGGVAKALLPADASNETFLGRIVATARAAGTEDLVVVVGPPHGESVAAHARELGCTVVHNDAPARGMASSVALGFAALAPTDATAAWLWPVDHPDIDIATLHILVRALGPHAAARPVHGGCGGHPPLISRALWAGLAACADRDGGARQVLASADVIDIAVGDRGVVRDIDTTVDLEAR